MVRHIVAWNYADNFTKNENEMNAIRIKEELESLKDLISGIVSIEVFLYPLNSSDSDILLDCVFESEEALKAYQVHPEHIRVGSTVVRPATCNRKCIDFFLR